MNTNPIWSRCKACSAVIPCKWVKGKIVPARTHYNEFGTARCRGAMGRPIRTMSPRDAKAAEAVLDRRESVAKWLAKRKSTSKQTKTTRGLVSSSTGQESRYDRLRAIGSRPLRGNVGQPGSGKRY